MNPESNLSLKRSKQTGTWLCLGSMVAGGIFLIGIFQGAYWALAIPVTIAVLGFLNLSFWIGYTISTIDVIPEEADQYKGGKSRRIALGICLGSVFLALLFLAGVFNGSYLALALPVAIVILGILGMIFWIGWTIVTMNTSPPENPPEEKAEESEKGQT